MRWVFFKKGGKQPPNPPPPPEVVSSPPSPPVLSGRSTRYFEDDHHEHVWRSRPHREYGQFGNCYVFPPMHPDEIERFMSEPGPFDPPTPRQRKAEPQVSNEPADPITDLAAGCAQLHELFLEYQKAGFTRVEALSLVAAVLAAGIHGKKA